MHCCILSCSWTTPQKITLLKHEIESLKAAAVESHREHQELSVTSEAVQDDLSANISALKKQSMDLEIMAKLRSEKVQSLEAEVEDLKAERDELHWQAKIQTNTSNERLKKVALHNTAIFDVES